MPHSELLPAVADAVSRGWLPTAPNPTQASGGSSRTPVAECVAQFALGDAARTPVTRLALEELATLTVGDTLKVVATDKGSVLDFQ